MHDQPDISGKERPTQNAAMCAAFGYALLGFVVLAAVIFWPPKSGRVIIISPTQSVNQLWSVLENTDARVVDLISPGIAIVESSQADFTSQLIKNGAFLVLNPLGAYGCGQSKPAAFQKEI